MFTLSVKTVKVFLFMSIIGLLNALMAEAPAIWGSKHITPYIPYSAITSQIIYVTNHSSKGADLNITAFDDKGNMYDLQAVTGSIPQKTVTKLTSQINQKLLELGFTGGKVAFTFIVNNPDVEIYTSYNAGSVRGYVETKKSYLLTSPK